MSIIPLLVLESMILATAIVDAPPEAGPRALPAGLPVHPRFKIQNGLHRAHRALDRHPACRDLFRELGAEGDTSLAALRFHLATPEQTRSICTARSAVLFTTLHGHNVGICPVPFAKIPVPHTAQLFLHEALHHAGLEEQPHRPDALQSREVTALVREMCGS